MRCNRAVDNCFFGRIHKIPSYSSPHVAVSLNEEVISVPKQWLRRDTSSLICCRESLEREEEIHASYQDEINKNREVQETMIESFTNELDIKTESFRQEFATLHNKHTRELNELIERVTAADANDRPD